MNDAVNLKLELIVSCAIRIEKFLAMASHNEIHDLLLKIKTQAKDSMELLTNGYDRRKTNMDIVG